MPPPPTLIDRYNEMGMPANLLLLLFLAMVVWGSVIHIRRAGPSLRMSYLIASFLPLAVGIAGFCYHCLDFIAMNRSACVRMPASSVMLWTLQEGGLSMIQLTAWLTIILLVFSAVLFITGKKEEEPEDAEGCVGQTFCLTRPEEETAAK